MSNLVNLESNKKKPLYSLKAPTSKAVRRSGNKSGQYYRTEFMRDRDRILYSKAFRRLAGKTQVYLFGIDDHRRNRLTHTLEVSQIARSIAKSLQLDSDLTEAIALGHDLGHTPFGHAGERALHEIMTPQQNHALGNDCPLSLQGNDIVSENWKQYLGFKHNLQSLVCCMELEKNYGNYGLDLTNYTLYGIQSHSKSRYNSQKVCNYDMLGFYDRYLDFCKPNKSKNSAWSLECLVVAEADEIAQRHHDVEDALRGELISRQELISIIWDCFTHEVTKKRLPSEKKLLEMDAETFISNISRYIVDMLVSRLIESSVKNINQMIHQEKLKGKLFADYTGSDKFSNSEWMNRLICYSETKTDTRFEEAVSKFENLISERVLSSHDIQTIDAKGKYIIRKLFQAYYSTPQQLPDHCVLEFLNWFNSEKYSRDKLNETILKNGIGSLRADFVRVIRDLGVEDKLKLMRVICNYIAGMTDSYCQKMYEQLYG